MTTNYPIYTDYQKEPICPYCGTPYDEIWDNYTLDWDIELNVRCSKCENEYKIEARAEVFFTTTKIKHD